MGHPYSTDSPERKYIPFLIAAAAIGASFLSFQVVETFRIKLPWWASPPVDTMAFYGLFWWLFDRFIWKWGLLRLLHITRVPDLSGQWQGHVHPAPAQGISADLVEDTAITLTVQQTWTKLLVRASTETSRSVSVTGSILTADEGSLSYEYQNEPFAPAPGTMHVHRGVVRLRLLPGGTVLEGEYFSGRDRQTFGTLRVRRLMSSSR